MKDRFDARSVLVEERAGFLDMRAGREVQTFDEVPVMGVRHQVFVYSGCTTDKEGKCNVTAEFKVYNASGIPVLSTIDPIEVCAGVPSSPLGQWKVSQAESGIGQFSAPGNYLVMTIFTDRNADGAKIFNWEILRVVDRATGSSR